VEASCDDEWPIPWEAPGPASFALDAHIFSVRPDDGASHVGPARFLVECETCLLDGVPLALSRVTTSPPAVIRAHLRAVSEWAREREGGRRGS